MPPFATPRWAAVLLLAFAVPAALAQSDPLGDEFIIFVDGTNILVPGLASGEVVNDPLDATSGNKVMKFSTGNWTEAGFEWNRSEGVDASANVGATYGEGDTLYFRMLSDVANATETSLSILISDATDDSGAPRADVEAGTETADYQMRLVWTIPVELHDGQWHDLAIPLPPATYDALEAAREAGELMSGAENWRYTGAWSLGGFGIGEVGGFAPPTSDPLWQEFGWDQLYRIGPFWDNEVGDGGPIYLDDVYIGGPNTSTDGTQGQPVAMSGVTFEADGEVNTVSWSDVDGVGGYNVYASTSPITDVSADGVILFDRVLSAQGGTFEHRYEVPLEGYRDAPLYYAVTSLSNFGVENPDVSNSSGEVVNPDIPVRPTITKLTTEQSNALFDALEGNTVVDAFPADQPVFDVSSAHRSASEGDLPSDDDNSARLKIGYDKAEGDLFIYGEVTDDVVQFVPSDQTGGTAYLFDSVELGFGAYDVRLQDGGNLLTGSPHQNMERGDAPDHQFRFSGLLNTAGELTGGSTWESNGINMEVPGGKTVAEQTDTGWRFLSIVPLDAFQAAGDAILALPEDDEFVLIPFNIAINDADDTGQRETQIQWSIKPNTSNQWWNTPAEWETVAVAGPNAVFVDAEDAPALAGFALEQNAPNPATGTAEITFSLGAAGPATVEVFNTLGQRVALVAEGDFAAGDHTVSVDTRSLAAGVYLYRLSAGEYVATRRMTVVR